MKLLVSVCDYFHIRIYLFSLVDSSTYAVVNFVEEDRTGVVPLHRITGDGLQEGERVTVLWLDKKQYPGIFLFSGENFKISSNVSLSQANDAW